MRKLTLAVLSAFFFLSASQAQEMFKIMDEFQRKMKDTSATAYGNNASAGKFYDIRGIKMYCEIYGEGKPLLIIHGNGGSINNFVFQIPFFKEKYKVIIADSRAQGKSADPGDSLTYEMMADDYAALLTTLKVDSAYVIGWSDGGIEGLLLAMRHPEKVKKLAVTGANLVPDTTAVPQSIWDMVMPDYTALKNKTNKTETEKKQFKLFNLLATEPHIPAESLKTVKCPTLVIGGDHDVIKEEHTMQIYKNIPQAYLWILPGSGHSTPIVYKDDFNKVVDRFFTYPYRTYKPQDRFF